MTLRIERYGNSRFWALYEGQDLVVVTVYKRGAREVQRRLAAQPRATAEGAAEAAAQEAAARQVQELAAQARALARQVQELAAQAGPGPRPAGQLGGSGWRLTPPAQLGRATGAGRPLAPRIPPGGTGGPTFPPEPPPGEEPRSARWQGWPAGGFSAGHLRSPCQKEGAEGLRSSSAPGGEK